MNTVIKLTLSLLFVLGLMLDNSFGLDKQGTTGKITGKIVDSKDKAPLTGATIKVNGTNQGANSDENGEYTILNVDVGTYVVTATYIGYDLQSIPDVKVSADLTTTVNFALKTTGSEIVTELIEIVGKRNAISPDQSGQIIDKEFIDNSGIRGIENIASTTAGVVQDEKGTNVNIRGGRTNETAVIIDGVLTTNPLNGKSSAFVGNSTLEELAVLTGGFSAEYGNVLSGVINVTTKGGTDIYTGSIEGITDQFSGKSISQGYNVYNFSFGGPLIPSKKLSRFINFYAGVERDFSLVDNPVWISDQLGLNNNVLPGFSNSRWSGNGKLNVDLQELNKKLPIQLKFGTNISDTHRRRYINGNMLYNFASNPEILEKNNQYYGKVNHQISPKVFYEVQLNYFKVSSDEQDPNFKDNFYMYGAANGGANPPADPHLYGLFSVPGTVRNNFAKSTTSYWEGNLNMTAQVKRNEIKFGGSYKYHTLRYYQLYPLKTSNYAGIRDRGNRDSLKTVFDNLLQADYYGYNFDNTGEVDNGVDGAKHPIIGAVYLQDKVEFKDFTLNAGIRWDYLDANSWRIKDLTNITRFSATPGVLDANAFTDVSDPTSAFSPRLGLSFPVTNNTIFHAQYGKFIQLPTLENLYIGRANLEYWVNTAGFSGSFGNPNLKPEKTTSYEIGVKQQIGDRLSADVTAYYKETEDLIGIKKYPQLPNQLQVYENQDYGTLRGVDISLDLRRTNRLALNIAYSLSYASGTGSDPDAASTAAWLGTRQPKLTFPLNYDQRHSGVVNLDYRFGKTDVPKGVVGNILSQMGINLLYQFNSGRPYSIKDASLDPITTSQGANGGAPLKSTINGAYGPWNNRLDLKVDKTINFVKNLDLNFYVYVINLLDSKLVNNVWSSSGDPGSTGYLTTLQGQQTANGYENPANGLSKAEYMRLYDLRSKIVANYGPPRQIRFGAKLTF